MRHQLRAAGARGEAGRRRAEAFGAAEEPVGDQRGGGRLIGDAVFRAEKKRGLRAVVQIIDQGAGAQKTAAVLDIHHFRHAGAGFAPCRILTGDVFLAEARGVEFLEILGGRQYHKLRNPGNRQLDLARVDAGRQVDLEAGAFPRDHR